MKDDGSRNGSFINNHRLIKNFKESEETQLFSDDIIRFVSSRHFTDLTTILVSGSVPKFGTIPQF